MYLIGGGTRFLRKADYFLPHYKRRHVPEHSYLHTHGRENLPNFINFCLTSPIFHGNLFSGSPFVPCGQMDVLVRSVRDFSLQTRQNATSATTSALHTPVFEDRTRDPATGNEILYRTAFIIEVLITAESTAALRNTQGGGL
jgi:hypothetical protein